MLFYFTFGCISEDIIHDGTLVGNAGSSKGKLAENAFFVYGSSADEKKYIKFKRSIYVSKNIKKGEIFTKENLKIVRPGHGLHPKFYFTIMGKKAKKNLKFATALKSSYM